MHFPLQKNKRKTRQGLWKFWGKCTANSLHKSLLLRNSILHYLGSQHLNKNKSHHLNTHWTFFHKFIFLGMKLHKPHNIIWLLIFFGRDVVGKTMKLICWLQPLCKCSWLDKSFVQTCCLEREPRAHGHSTFFFKYSIILGPKGHTGCLLPLIWSQLHTNSRITLLHSPKPIISHLLQMMLLWFNWPFVL